MAGRLYKGHHFSSSPGLVPGVQSTADEASAADVRRHADVALRMPGTSPGKEDDELV
jgi:hypothetical protein